MKSHPSVRQSILVSSSFTIGLLLILLLVVWQGFERASSFAQREHASAQPALLAVMNARFHVVQIQQFLTDVSATGERGGFEEAEAHLNEARADLARVCELLAEMARDTDAIGTLLDQFHAAGRRMADAYLNDGQAAGNAIMKEPQSGFDDRAAALTERLDALESRVRAGMDTAAEATSAGITQATWGSLGLGLAVMLLSLLGSTLLYRALRGMLGGEPRDAVTIAQRIAAGDLSAEIAIRAGDDASLMVSLRRMQDELRARLEADRRAADEMRRIKSALDEASTNMMMVDPQGVILYVNSALTRLMREAEPDIRQALPGFEAARLVGGRLESLWRDAARARLLIQAGQTQSDTLELGARLLRIAASPVTNEAGQRLGTVLEWTDRTLEARAETELSQLLTAVAAGDFSRRLDLADKQGFLREIAEGMNQLTERVERALADLGGVLRALAGGDLTQWVHEDYQGSLGQIKEDTNGTVSGLCALVGQIKSSVDAIDTAAREIALGNADLSQRTEEQAASLEETASSMEELTSTVRQTADNARQANLLAASARGLADQVARRMSEADTSMRAITESSGKIGNIITVIDGIAFQTNILALNAAVEAARAGEQGRGFAVVAAEVRNLAQRSATAAKEIKTLIAEDAETIANGGQRVREAGESLSEVLGHVQRVSDLIAEISAASDEQSSGIDQVGRVIAQMDEVTQRNASLVEQAAAAAEALEEQAQGLAQAVGRFRLEASEHNVMRTGSNPVRPAAGAGGSGRAAAALASVPSSLRGSSDEWEAF